MLLNIMLVAGIIALAVSAVVVTRPLARVSHGMTTQRYPGDVRDFALSFIFLLSLVATLVTVMEGLKFASVVMLWASAILGLVLNVCRTRITEVETNDQDSLDADTDDHAIADQPAVDPDGDPVADDKAQLTT